MRFGPRSVLISAAVLVLAACASLPPAAPRQDLASVAGKWEGRGNSPSGPFYFVLTVAPDGAWQGQSGDRTFVGNTTLVDGKLQYKSETTGRTGTWTLHEGNGRRVLLVAQDDPPVSMQLTPAR